MKSRNLLMLVAAASVACGRNDAQPTEQRITKGGPPLHPKVTPSQATIRVGDTLRFTVTPTAEFPAPEGWRWTSLTPTVVVDSITGIARGAAQGVTTVVATAVGHPDWKGGGSLTVVP